MPALIMEYVDTGDLDFRTLYKSFSDYDITYCVIVIRPFKLIIIVTVGMYIKNEIWEHDLARWGA